jgi:GcrA cell cycle regulator
MNWQLYENAGALTRPPVQPAWTNELTKQLKAMWAEGLLSAREIGIELGMTRNAVIGKVHRLGLEARGSGTRHGDRKQRKPREPRARSTPFRPAQVVAMTKKLDPPPRPASADDPLPASLMVPILSPERLTGGSCRWIVERNGSRFYCAAPGADFPQYPYCPAHQRMAWRQ